MIIRIVVALWFLFSGSAFAQYGSGSSNDPFVLPAIPGHTFNQGTGAVSLRPQTLNPAVRNLVAVVAGQSNVCNVMPSAYSPSNASAIDNFNIYDGATYAAADPLLGADMNPGNGPGNAALRLADNLITAGLFDRVVLVPVGINASDVAFWQGSYAANRIPVALARLAARGIVAGTNVTIIVIWGQGESDNAAGTAQATYTAGLNAVIATSRAAGFNGTWFVAKQTYISGAASATIQAGQAAVVNHGAGVWAGPDADALVGSTCSGVACRQADLTHFSNAGAASYATAWQAALHLFGAPF